MSSTKYAALSLDDATRHSCNCVQTRDAIMQRVVESGNKDGLELDILAWSGRTTLEVLGQAGLGVSFDPLTEDRPDAFGDAVKDFLCVLLDLRRSLLVSLRRLADHSFFVM